MQNALLEADQNTQRMLESQRRQALAEQAAAVLAARVETERLTHAALEKETTHALHMMEQTLQEVRAVIATHRHLSSFLFCLKECLGVTAAAPINVGCGPLSHHPCSWLNYIALTLCAHRAIRFMTLC